MQAKRHLSDADIGDLLAGYAGPGREHVAECPKCAAEWRDLASARDHMRAELDWAADRPQHFWMRQHARARDRMTVRGSSLRWPALAMALLALVTFGLLNGKPSAPVPAPQTQTADADDLLLKDIQYSLAQRAPEPLLPATVLLHEMTTNSKDQKRDD